jgi:hypothetical protein
MIDKKVKGAKPDKKDGIRQDIAIVVNIGTFIIAFREAAQSSEGLTHIQNGHTGKTYTNKKSPMCLLKDHATNREARIAKPVNRCRAPSFSYFLWSSMLPLLPCSHW